jgi:hypothetical protein
MGVGGYTPVGKKYSCNVPPFFTLGEHSLPNVHRRIEGRTEDFHPYLWDNSPLRGKAHPWGAASPLVSKLAHMSEIKTGLR